MSCKRVRQAARFVWAVDRSLDSDMAPPATLAGAWFELTALPVSTEHDEYFFLRALQAHELVFTTLTDLLRAATTAARSGRLDEATTRVARASAVFERASLLFRLVATMSVDAFHAFRRYTDGASAIQSEAYKRFEIACGEPSTARLASEAFAGVPAVREEADDHDNLARALTDLPAGGPRPGATALAEAVAKLEAAHQRWKTTTTASRSACSGTPRARGTPPESPTWPHAAPIGSWASATTPQPDPACAAEPPTCMGGGSRRAAPQGAVQALDVRERVAPVLGPSGCQFAFSGPVSPGRCLWPACGSRRRRKRRAGTHKGDTGYGLAGSARSSRWPVPGRHALRALQRRRWRRGGLREVPPQHPAASRDNSTAWRSRALTVTTTLLSTLGAEVDAIAKLACGVRLALARAHSR